nr:1-deoxy-D-xylulose-5-phosphate reductoisomerase [Lachnospiraceae bacterium]
MKKISIIGSTGSIGTQTLQIADENEDLKIVAMSCKSSLDTFEKQIRKYRPSLVAVGDEKAAADLKERIADIDGVEVQYGMEGLIAVATHSQAQIVVTAVVGMIGIRPTIAAIEAGKDIALANKET